jgi:CRP-like cAMP-binding protein
VRHSDFSHSGKGREQVLAMNHADESVTVEDTEIASISRQDFLAFCMAHPEVALLTAAPRPSQ